MTMPTTDGERKVGWSRGFRAMVIAGVIVVVAAIVVYRVNDVKTRPATGDSPPNLPAWPDHEVEVCGWINEGSVVCFEQARSDGRGAELWTVWNTIEGDPVYLIHRSTPDGRIIVFYDSSADQFGSGSGFTSQACVDLRLEESDRNWFSEPVGCGRSVRGW